jgi:hypothetical protein
MGDWLPDTGHRYIGRRRGLSIAIAVGSKSTRVISSHGITLCAKGGLLRGVLIGMHRGHSLCFERRTWLLARHLTLAGHVSLLSCLTDKELTPFIPRQLAVSQRD